MTPRRRRILCAEPNEDTCFLITTLFTRQGHEVVSASSIRECMDAAGSQAFDLYMLDDDYIDGTSIELCRQLRRLTPQTPILFFSAQALGRDRERALAAGASAYLVKPDDLFEIVQTVNSILSGPRREGD
ncbi:MAG TPA: response regulator [Pyrinomonadaceae bacterium]|nr:response regulator [Pyrinomonadaceae bacterium]